MTNIMHQAARSRRVDRWQAFALIVAILTLVVGVGDVVSTNQGLAAGAVELNPLFAWIQAALGAWWFLPKMALHGIVAAMVLWYPQPMVLAVVIPIILANSAIILNNFALAAV